MALAIFGGRVKLYGHGSKLEDSGLNTNARKTLLKNVTGITNTGNLYLKIQRPTKQHRRKARRE